MTTLLELKRNLEKLLWEQPELAIASVYTAEDDEGNSFRKIVGTDLTQAFVPLNFFGNLPHKFDEFEDALYQGEPEDGWERVLILN